MVRFFSTGVGFLVLGPLLGVAAAEKLSCVWVAVTVADVATSRGSPRKRVSGVVNSRPELRAKSKSSAEWSFLRVPDAGRPAASPQ